MESVQLRVWYLLHRQECSALFKPVSSGPSLLAKAKHGNSSSLKGNYRFLEILMAAFF